MSRAFVKDDASNERIIVLPRASLPPGAPNYVTSRGMALLRAELADLTAERARLQADEQDEAERARQLAVVRERLEALAERVASAEVVALHDPPPDEVAFGATVTVRTLSGKFAGEERRFTIVGVDEAAALEACVAFTAPIACALLGCKLGDEARLQTAGSVQVLKVVALDYEG